MEPEIGHVYVNRKSGAHAVLVTHIDHALGQVGVTPIRVALEKSAQSIWQFIPRKEDGSGWIPWMRFAAEFRKVSG